MKAAKACTVRCRDQDCTHHTWNLYARLDVWAWGLDIERQSMRSSN